MTKHIYLPTIEPRRRRNPVGSLSYQSRPPDSFWKNERKAKFSGGQAQWAKRAKRMAEKNTRVLTSQ